MDTVYYFVLFYYVNLHTRTVFAVSFKYQNTSCLAAMFLIKYTLQVLNGSPYNRKCDVYSFGICLWEIYCCDMPYPDLSFSEVTSAVVRQVMKIGREA